MPEPGSGPVGFPIKLAIPRYLDVTRVEATIDEERPAELRGNPLESARVLCWVSSLEDRVPLGAPHMTSLCLVPKKPLIFAISYQAQRPGGGRRRAVELQMEFRDRAVGMAGRFRARADDLAGRCYLRRVTCTLRWQPWAFLKAARGRVVWEVRTQGRNVPGRPANPASPRAGRGPHGAMFQGILVGRFSPMLQPGRPCARIAA
jgi:hypothetical protein